jgi:alkaline phosphatase
VEHFRRTSPRSGTIDRLILTAVGPGSDSFRGQMDNTEFFRVMAEALGLGLSD